MVRGFQLAVASGLWIGLVVKEAVGQRAAELLVEPDEGKGDFGALTCEPVSIAFAIPLNQSMRLAFCGDRGGVDSDAEYGENHAGRDKNRVEYQCLPLLPMPEDLP